MILLLLLLIVIFMIIVFVSLQEDLDALASSTGPFCRVFIRPSGTEDVARIYAEAPEAKETERLAETARGLLLEAANDHKRLLKQLQQPLLEDNETA